MNPAGGLSGFCHLVRSSRHLAWQSIITTGSIREVFFESQQPQQTLLQGTSSAVSSLSVEFLCPEDSEDFFKSRLHLISVLFKHKVDLFCSSARFSSLCSTRGTNGDDELVDWTSQPEAAVSLLCFGLRLHSVSVTPRT